MKGDPLLIQRARGMVDRRIQRRIDEAVDARVIPIFTDGVRAFLVARVVDRKPPHGERRVTYIEIGKDYAKTIESIPWANWIGNPGDHPEYARARERARSHVRS